MGLGVGFSTSGFFSTSEGFNFQLSFSDLVGGCVFIFPIRKPTKSEGGVVLLQVVVGSRCGLRWVIVCWEEVALLLVIVSRGIVLLWDGGRLLRKGVVLYWLIVRGRWLCCFLPACFIERRQLS